jgi:hypothetical protein
MFVEVFGSSCGTKRHRIRIRKRRVNHRMLAFCPVAGPDFAPVQSQRRMSECLIGESFSSRLVLISGRKVALAADFLDTNWLVPSAMFPRDFNHLRGFCVG